MDEKFRIKTLPGTLFFDSFKTSFEEITLALAEHRFTNPLSVREIFPVDAISHQRESEGGDDGDSCEPDGESNEAENHRVLGAADAMIADPLAGEISFTEGVFSVDKNFYTVLLEQFWRDCFPKFSMISCQDNRG